MEFNSDCNYIGSNSYEGGKFITEKGEFFIRLVIDYYDLPLSMLIENNETFYIGVVCSSIFDSFDSDGREWYYTLVEIPFKDYTDIIEDKLECSLSYFERVFGEADLGIKIRVNRFGWGSDLPKGFDGYEVISLKGLGYDDLD